MWGKPAVTANSGHELRPCATHCRKHSGTGSSAIVVSMRPRAYLRRQGLKILHRGYRTDHGEIDLIALEGNVIVFVEVKARRRGSPAAAVTEEKQRRLTLTAFTS